MSSQKLSETSVQFLHSFPSFSSAFFEGYIQPKIMTIYIISIYPPPSTLSRRITTFLVGYTVNVNLYLPLESWMGVVDPILYTAIFYCRNHGFANALEAFVQDRPGSTKTKNCLTKLHVSSPTKIKRKISLVFFFFEGNIPKW